MNSTPTASGICARVCLAAGLLLLMAPLIAAQERPFDTTPCGLLLHPDKYEEGLVSVEGLLIVGPDEFTLHDANCGDANGRIWLQFGGGVASPGQSNPSRGTSGRPRTVEGLELPLTRDRDFDTMQELLRTAQKSGKTKMLRATLIGKYFPGKPTKTLSGEAMRSGYGRMGCCSLLVIEEVAKVASELEEPVDFSPVSAVSSRSLVRGCTVSQVQLPPQEDEDQLERTSLEEEYQYLHDPKKVAARAIAVQESLEADAVEKHVQADSTSASLASYTWNSADGSTSYRIVVNKPYWLLKTAAKGDVVIWAPKQMTRTKCASDKNSATNPISPIPTIPHEHGSSPDDGEDAAKPR